MDQSVFKRIPQYRYGNLVTDFILGWPNEYKFFFFVRFDLPSLNGSLKTFATTIAEEILT